MALIENYIVAATNYAIASTSLEIKEGMFVALIAAGVRRATTGDDAKILGVAGDTKSTSASGMPGVGKAYIGADSSGAAVSINMQNRASDYFDETKSSGKLTVYHSGGEFATDQWTAVTAGQIGAYLKVVCDGSALNTGKLTYDGATKGNNTVAMLVGAPGAYPSGVPGTDINGDMALGGDNNNQYLVFKLLV